MTKILTISEPECGGKPTGYAVTIPNSDFKTLEGEILKGLRKGWGFNERDARDAVIEEDVDALKEQGYTYLKERFIVEVTVLDDETNRKLNLKTPVHPFSRFHVEANVLWDYEEGDTPPEPKFEVTFTPEELIREEVLDKGGIEDVNTWFIDEVKLEEFLGEYLTDFTDFCHKGFTFEWECK